MNNLQSIQYFLPELLIIQLALSIIILDLFSLKKWVNLCVYIGFGFISLLLCQLTYSNEGFSIFNSKILALFTSPEIFIATAAERTKNIKFGTGVISLPYHHPLMVANRMILLDHLTKGRVMLGVGPGALVTDAYMLGIDPKTQRHKMDESLGIILK